MDSSFIDDKNFYLELIESQVGNIAMAISRASEDASLPIETEDEEESQREYKRAIEVVMGVSDLFGSLSSRDRIRCMDVIVRISKSLDVHLMAMLYKQVVRHCDAGREERQEVIETLLNDPVVKARIRHIVRVSEIGFALSPFSLARIEGGIEAIKRSVYEKKFI